jgi:hypothetical protein
MTASNFYMETYCKNQIKTAYMYGAECMLKQEWCLFVFEVPHYFQLLDFNFEFFEPTNALFYSYFCSIHPTYVSALILFGHLLYNWILLFTTLFITTLSAELKIKLLVVCVIMNYYVSF